MAGHSHWSNIKRRKKAQDKKKAKKFSKLSRKISVAAKEGGGDPEFNPQLRMAIEKAKSEDMPKENIERAIKKGTGELEGVDYEEIMFEGFGPAEMKVIISVLTDNRNRTVAELRTIFEEFGGNLGEDGSVRWLFEKKGYFVILKNSAPEKIVLEVALENGAQDYDLLDDAYEIYCEPDDYTDLSEAFRDAKVSVEYSEVGMIPNATRELNGKKALKARNFIDKLEDHDDVEKVWFDCEIPEEPD